jgi:alkaline phosphatase D
MRHRSTLAPLLIVLAGCGGAAGGRPPGAPQADANAPPEDSDAAVAPADGAQAPDAAGANDARVDGRAADSASPTDAAAAEVHGEGGAPAGALERIAFGSCNYASRDPAFWSKITARQPQVFLMLGDALYLDHGETYAELGAAKELAQLLAVARPLVIWDDHDYGGNDTGAGFGDKRAAKAAFLAFWSSRGAIASDSARSTREGNYDATIIGPPGREVQFLMLDNRYFKGNPPNGTVLGPAQWAWLAEELRKPARLRIIMSGMELISTSTTPEGWGQFPAEQDHLYQTLRESGAKGALIVSGDKHYLEISRRDAGLVYPLYYFTSSPMSAPPEPPEANRYRDAPGSIISDNNFGLMTIDWSAPDPTLHVELIQSYQGTLLLEKRLTLGELGSP